MEHVAEAEATFNWGTTRRSTWIQKVAPNGNVKAGHLLGSVKATKMRITTRRGPRFSPLLTQPEKRTRITCHQKINTAVVSMCIWVWDKISPPGDRRF